MKTFKSTLIMSLVMCTLFFACSTEETEDNSDQESEAQVSVNELRNTLIDSGPWTVDGYEVLDVTFSSNDTITNEEISNHVLKRQLRGYTLDFLEDGTVKIDFPATGDHMRTWRILLGSILIFNDSQIPQFWQNANVDGNTMSIDLDIYSVVEENPAVVEHFGRLYFRSLSSQ